MEFFDSTNARESGRRFIGGSLGCDDFEEDFEALFAGEGVVVGAVGGFGFGVGFEYLKGAMHMEIISGITFKGARK